ncbi:MAG: lyase [Verrucomicrobiaceae bacterium]|nr:MAG: lyase [Verrucomicrobiaceae bacterium]
MQRTKTHFLRALVRILVMVPAMALAAQAAVLNSPSQPAVNAAVSAGLISYGKGYSGGAYTNGSWSGGASITLAVASHAGNTTADARLLQQIRHTLSLNNEPCANGGYPAQHELHATGMFAIVKNTPRIWSQITTPEKTKIDLIMKASFVACAFTTSNNNPYLASQRTLDGDFNLNRDWNPNYREGMLGGVLVGMTYFGGPTAGEAILNSYNHAEFVAQLKANNLNNAYATFNSRAAGVANAPSGTDIQNGVRNYKYYNSGLSDFNGIYTALVNDTYGKNVNAGLNNGAGINGGGKIVSGADTLPNKGAAGMLKEFDSGDAGGARSSLIYAYDGYRPHQTNQLVLIIGGFWQKGSTTANNAVAKMKIGNTDLAYKIQKGYIDYSKGKVNDFRVLFRDNFGSAYVMPLWTDVLLPYHNAVTPPPDPDPTRDTDGDGTPDVVETRLGLNPASANSRFSITITPAPPAATVPEGAAAAPGPGPTLQWPSAAGLTFIVQRSSAAGTIVWETIATLPGTATTASWTDPAPPADRAFYRVGLQP